MTASVALPRHARHPAWYAPLLLPVLPLLATLWTNPGSLNGPRTSYLLLLATFGWALGLGLPAILDRMPMMVRKEASLLRDAWMALFFPAQVPLLADASAGLAGLGLMFFALSCAVLASMPVGLEFQQRTLAGLLSQPIRRSESWNAKSSVLALALGSHVLAFLASAGAANRAMTPVFVLSTLAIAAVAWGTTPWWTLVTRNLLAGLAFSLAAPLLVIGLGSAVIQHLGADGPFETRVPDYGESWSYLLLLGAAPVAAVVGLLDSARRWRRLEAPDTEGAVWGTFGFPGLGTRDQRSLRRSPVLGLLLRKEARIQSVSFILLAVSALFLGVARFGVSETMPSLREFVLALFALSAVTTVILAGASSIAEERRLGTLESQLIQPVSRGTLWWSKLAVGTALAAVVAWMMIAAFAPGAGRGDRWQSGEIIQVCFLSFGVLAFALLASSTASQPLRAVVSTVVILAGFGALIGAAITVEAELAERANREAYNSAWNDVPRWTAEAEALSPEQAQALYQRSRVPPAARAWFFPLLLGLNSLPILGALAFARRNFLHPGESRSRLPRQAAICLVAFATLAAGWIAATTSASRQRAHEDALVSIRSFVDLQHRFSPADQALWQTFHTSPYSTFIAIPLRPQAEAGARNDPQGFALPLTPKSRRLLIHRADITDDIRQLLREEGTRKGEDLSPPPPEPRRRVPEATPPPLGGSRMSPAMMKRYGLVAPPNVSPTTEAPAQPLPAPTAPQSPPQIPRNPTPP